MALWGIKQNLTSFAGHGIIFVNNRQMSFDIRVNFFGKEYSRCPGPAGAGEDGQAL